MSLICMFFQFRSHKSFELDKNSMKIIYNANVDNLEYGGISVCIDGDDHISVANAYIESTRPRDSARAPDPLLVARARRGC